MQLNNPNPDLYLKPCSVIDYEDPEVSALSESLAGSSDEACTRNSFEFVRDRIQHSSDYQLNPVTCSASQVLRYGTGFCYAKSHLLCGLLRANRIPAGLCYQRLKLASDSQRYCLHGLVAVHLSEHGWYRLDPRGNREGISSEFDPPTERLPFCPTSDGEADLGEIFLHPLPQVVSALSTHSSWKAVSANLPDVESIQWLNTRKI